MRARSFTRLFAGVTVSLAACAGEPADITSPSSNSFTAVESQDETQANIVARAIALALNNAEIRLSVRDAMRASLVTEHKLLLQDFVRTPAGQRVLQEGANKLGVTLQYLEKTVEELPQLDFYVPSRNDRRQWRGEGGLQLGVAMRADVSTIKAFDSKGLAASVARGASSRGSVRFILQPAERKSRRIGAQPSVPGNAIEEPGDGQLSGSIVEYLPNGTVRVTDLADYLQPSARLSIECDTFAIVACDGETGGGGGDVTYLEHVIIIGVCDNFDCDQGNEFEWHTYFSSNNGSTWGNRFDLRIEGVGSTSETTYHLPALFKMIRTPNERIQSDVIETDGISPSDHFDPSPQWLVGQAGAVKSEGDLRCDYPKSYGGTYTCGVPYTWREVNQSMVW